MDDIYSLADVAMMTGLTTRTLRSYLSRGLLKGKKTGGAWRFGEEELKRFFEEPFVKQGLGSKRSSTVFNFLTKKNTVAARTCIILDIPASAKKGREIAEFFCERMKTASDALFSFDFDTAMCRVILSGAANQIAGIMEDYNAMQFGD